MGPVRVESSLLASVRYDADRQRLHIDLRNGERYVYFQVPASCYELLLESESKGIFFNTHIRKRFAYQHVSDPSAPVVMPDPETPSHT
jgi:KTSC domain